ncbi:MAG: OmpH family outer membrane protein [Planctomycetaceae bacterium]|nr:OmpH family outer membrane protein [Planctomycetaceae bacterium]
MKRFTLFTFCLGLALSVVQTSATVQAQTPAETQSKKSIGLIDMAHLFKEYKKFADKRDTLRNEIKGSDEQAKAMAEKLKTMQVQLKSGTFAEGSDEFNQLEANLITGATQFEAYKKTQQQRFLRSESKVYKEIYLEVIEVVGTYANYYNYDVIVRFNRSTVSETDSAQDLITNMNKQVVWHNQGIDITDQVLKFLNDRYQPVAKTATAPATGAPLK